MLLHFSEEALPIEARKEGGSYHVFFKTTLDHQKLSLFLRVIHIQAYQNAKETLNMEKKKQVQNIKYKYRNIVKKY